MPGGRRASIKFTDLSGSPHYLGVTGGPEAASVKLAGLSLDQFCAKPPTGCLPGSWSATRIEVSVAKLITLRGGAGMGMTIDREGRVTIDAAKMAPVEFRQLDDPYVSGHYVYAGKVSGTLSAAPGATAREGAWDIRDGTWQTMTGKVVISSPFEFVYGPLPLSEFASIAGAAPNGGRPLGTGTWSCPTPNTLTIRSTPGDVAGIWEFRRV